MRHGVEKRSPICQSRLLPGGRPLQLARGHQDMSAPVGIALVGMGWWGKKMLSVLEAAPQDIKVVRAVEPNLETVRSLCAEKGIALSADYADALNDPAVEAVV